MEYWQGPARWINTVLVAVLAVLAVHVLLLLVGAQESNLVVGLVARAARVVLTPVAGLFPRQGPLVTAVLGAFAAVGTALVVLAVLRGRQEQRAAHSAGGTPAAGAGKHPSGEPELRESAPERRTGS